MPESSKMINKNYELLSFTGQECYNTIVKQIEAYQTQWFFSQMRFDYIAKVYNAVLADHPEYFWLSSGCHGNTRIQGTQFNLTFEPRFEIDIKQVPEMRRRFNSTVDDLIRKTMRQTMVPYEQILFLHDYIVKNTDYVIGAPNCYDAYGCLVLHRAVCAGYAAAFQVLLQKLGIECGRVTGRSSSDKTGEVSHEWNYIKLRDEYYYIDVTWDDPVINSSCTEDNLSHDYFCVSFKEMQLSHSFAEDQFIPKKTGTVYNYYQYRGWYLDRYTFPAVRAIAMKQLQHADKFFVKFRTAEETKKAIRDLMEAQKIFSIPGVSQRLSYGVSKSGLIMYVEKRK